jgi:hypothetical protein
MDGWMVASISSAWNRVHLKSWSDRESRVKSTEDQQHKCATRCRPLASRGGGSRADERRDEIQLKGSKKEEEASE